MKTPGYEWRLIWRSRLALGALVLMLLVSTLAIVSGLREVAHQQQTLHRLANLQQQDMDLQASRYARSEYAAAGWAAYILWLNTWDAPGDSAFLALGLRDTSPWVLRVHGLALQSQLHEGDHFNPELALIGRFDFAFVLVYLAPLLLIALLHDLVSGERQSGRLATLLALPQTGRAGMRLWLHRAGLRTALALLCLVLPAIVGCLVSGASALSIASLLWTSAAYLAFWCGLALWVAACRGSTTRHATLLMACWVLLTLVLPTAANALLERTLPVRQGVDMMLAQHRITHAAWDAPRQQTMSQFFTHYPQWQHTAPLQDGFQWKWYYAFQHLADVKVSEQVAAYRHELLQRQRGTDRVGWLLPAAGVQAVLHRQAGTDLLAQLAYQDDITAFHTQIRHFYYPYLYEERDLQAEDFAHLPTFAPAPRPVQTPAASLIALGIMAVLTVLLGLRALRTGLATTE